MSLRKAVRSTPSQAPGSFETDFSNLNSCFRLKEKPVLSAMEKQLLDMKMIDLSIVAPAYNPNTWEAEEGRLPGVQI